MTYWLYTEYFDVFNFLVLIITSTADKQAPVIINQPIIGQILVHDCVIQIILLINKNFSIIPLQQKVKILLVLFKQHC